MHHDAHRRREPVMAGEGAGDLLQALGGMTGALAGVAPGGLCLGLALHLCNQLLRGRGWWAIGRAAPDGRPRVTRRDAVAAWLAGAGAAGVLTAQVGDALRIWLLTRRAPHAGYALVAGTLVAEGAGELVAGLPLPVVAVAVGVGAAPAGAGGGGAGGGGGGGL